MVWTLKAAETCQLFHCYHCPALVVAAVGLHMRAQVETVGLKVQILMPFSQGTRSQAGRVGQFLLSILSVQPLLVALGDNISHSHCIL